MTAENKGYALAITDRSTNQTVEKIYLKPMSLYVPEIAIDAVSQLLAGLPAAANNDKGFVMTVTNKNNGVSVDNDFDNLQALHDPLIVADAVKDLVNIVRGYESDEETNVCGW